MKLVLLIFVLLFPLGATAAVLHPYIVDEKPQVLFGDSTVITATSTYFGLENYEADYVGGFAHLSFTYTHHICCFANFPPYIYVTDADPRSTSTPLVKWNNAAYHLVAFTSTDWYLYDIQFDQTGFRVVVKKAGETEIYNAHTDVEGMMGGDWVSLVNYYPASSPPSDQSMAFTPVPISDVPPVPTIDPVIIIPGIMGSAYKNSELVIDPILHTYDDLIATLAANGYTEGVDLFTFPYEWRDSNVLSADLLKQKINAVKQICSCSKVDLVAHSNGGLVAREYIEHGGYQNDIDQLIFLATPHKGAPTDYLRWEAGEFTSTLADVLMKEFFVAESLKNGYLRVFDYIKGRPVSSVEELLPVSDYLKDKNTNTVRIYPNNYPRNLFLEALNGNTGMTRLLNSGVKISNFIGNSGSNTIEKIRVVSAVQGALWEHGKPDDWDSIIGDRGLERGMGDNTVTIQGATLGNSVNNQIVAGSHLRVPTIAEAGVFNILTGKIATTTFDRNHGTDVKVLLLQLLSPVDFVVIAPDGKKIGKNFSNGAEYNEIQDAFYSGYQTEDEYITILNPLDGEYKIELNGTGSGGKYTVLTSLISDATSTTAVFSSTTTPNQITDLKLTLDNAHPEAISVDPDVVADINRAYTNGWIKDKKTRDALLLQAKLLVRFQIKFDTIKKKKVERLEKVVDKVLAKLVLKQLDDLLKKKLITQDGYNLLKFDLNWLINH